MKNPSTTGNSKFNVTNITLNLGTSINDRLTEARKIKDAMSTAMLLLYEAGHSQCENPDMEVFTALFLEARYAESLLQKL